MENSYPIDFKIQYPDLIRLTAHRHPNYEEIDFKELISKLFPHNNLFIEDIELLNNCRKLREEHFKQYGIRVQISFSDLLYYQEFVGISGPKHTDINEPVSFLKCEKGTVLFNGYHRALLLLSKGQPVIEGYIADYDNPDIVAIRSN